VDFEQCRDGGESEEDARLDGVSEGLMGQTLLGGRGRVYEMNLGRTGILSRKEKGI
jgi:hypothetical protein